MSTIYNSLTNFGRVRYGKSYFWPTSGAIIRNLEPYYGQTLFTLSVIKTPDAVSAKSTLIFQSEKACRQKMSSLPVVSKPTSIANCKPKNLISKIFLKWGLLYADFQINFRPL